jgi:hypothetical protein
MHMRMPKIPYLYIEGPYENERGSDEQSLRANAYGTILSGACGQVFGNNPIWHFSGPGLYEQTITWQDSLASRGAQSMSHLKTFFNSIAWWKLEPEQGKLLPVQDSTPPGYAIGGRAPDGSLAVVYLFNRSSVVLNREALAKSVDRVRWFDPASGQYLDAAEKMTNRPELIQFEAPQARNSAGFGDWILILTDRNQSH